MATIRPVVATDLPAIHRIYAHEVLHGTATYEYAPPTSAEMACRVAAIVDAGYPFLVADDDGRAVAYAYASAYRSRDGYRWTVEDSVYVEPSAQGRGLGRLLLGRLIETELLRAYQIAGGNALEILNHPVALTIFGLMLASLAVSVWNERRGRRAADAIAE